MYYTYILTNKKNKIFYMGVTNNLFVRIEKHKTGFYVNSFTKKFNIDKLVWYECFKNIEDAILIEKKIKRWKREYKIDMINKFNPQWEELRDPGINPG